MERDKGWKGTRDGGGQGMERDRGWSRTRGGGDQEMEQDKGWRESEPQQSERKELRSLGGERLQEDHFHSLRTQRTFDKGLQARDHIARDPHGEFPVLGGPLGNSI